MKALTLWRPWTWAIASSSPHAKRIENRTWSPPRYILGDEIAIHAGKHYDDDAWESIADVMQEHPPGPMLCPTGIVAVARVVGYCTKANVRDEHRAWFTGPKAWILRDVRTLCEPVPCSGAQGLWIVPADVERLVRERLPAKNEGPGEDDLEHARRHV